MEVKFSLTTLFVKDIERSVAFYNKVLGLPISERFEFPPMKFAMLGDDDGTRIELIESEDMFPDGELGLGVRIGFVVDDIAPLEATLGHALNALEVPNPDYNFFMTRDPDGYAIEIMEIAG